MNSTLCAVARFGRLPLLMVTLASALFLGTRATRAAIPEPYNLLYGVIEMGGSYVTAANSRVTVEARRLPTAGTVARYVMGSSASAGNFYALKIRGESEGLTDPLAAAEAGTILYITVLSNNIIQNQLPFTTGARGTVQRLDFGNVDADLNGLPDGWEQAYFGQTGTDPNADPDIDGLSNLQEHGLGTDPTIADAPHPADLDRDHTITIIELANYYNAWRNGQPWNGSIGPTNIPLTYVTRGTYLWQQGGVYHFNSSVTDAPLWWVPGAGPSGARATLMGASPAGSDPEAPLLVRTVGLACYQPGEPVTLVHRVTVQGALRTYAVEHPIPEGWQIVEVPGGTYDRTNRIAKWGPFFDRANRDLSLTLRPPTDATGLANLEGAGSYDGYRVGIAGLRVLGDPVALAQQILLKPGGNADHWILEAVPGQNYVIEGSSDLDAWETVTQTPVDDTGLADLSLTNALTWPMRFYRARLAP
jgi:hypothetical protein